MLSHLPVNITPLQFLRADNTFTVWAKSILHNSLEIYIPRAVWL